MASIKKSCGLRNDLIKIWISQIRCLRVGRLLRAVGSHGLHLADTPWQGILVPGGRRGRRPECLALTRGRRPECLAWRLGRRPKWRAECGTGRAAGPSAAQLRSSAAGSAGLSGCGENGPQACVSGMKIGPQAQAANRPQACVSGNRAAGPSCEAA